MTRQDALKILAVLKIAYPNSYRGIDEDSASAMARLWATQFSNIPYSVVSLAVEQIISKSTFPPTIAEIKAELRVLWCNATTLLRMHEQSLTGEFGTEGRLDNSTVERLKAIADATECMRSGSREVPLIDLIQHNNIQLTADTKKLEGKS